MSIFLCRWPNGDFSVVGASTKDDAIQILDEVGNAEGAALTPMSECLFDFRLNDLGEIELGLVGSTTIDFIMEQCYPELERLLTDAETTDEDGKYTPAALKQIRAAVENERTRCLGGEREPERAGAQLGRGLQSRMDPAKVVMIREVRRTAREIIFEAEDSEGGKVQ
jgi:hypothetical protein